MKAESQSGVSFVLGLVIVAFFAGWLRFNGLEERELWFDEACTFYAVDHLLHFPEGGPVPRSEVAHWPYFLLLRAWTGVVGNTGWGLRSFSAVCGVAGVGLVGVLLGRVAGPRAGLIAAALAAVHPLHLYYSQEARVYALWMTEATLTFFVLLWAARSGRWRAWGAYAVVALVMVLTHYYTLFWLVGLAAAVPVVFRERGVVRRWLVTHVSLVVVVVPVTWWLIVPLARGGPVTWLEEIWRGYPPWLAVPRSVWAMLPSGGYPEYLGAVAVAAEAVRQLYGQAASFVASWGAVVVTGGLIVIGLISRAGRTAVRDDDASGTAATGGGRYDGNEDAAASGTAATGGGRDRGSIGVFAVVSTILFLVVAFAYSAFVRPIYVVGRYDLAAWPAVVIGLALLIEGLAQRWSGTSAGQSVLCAVATGAFVVCSGVTVLGAAAAPASRDTAERARRIAAHVDDEDLVISLGMYRWFLTYEWHRIGFSPEVLSFPRRHDRQLCWTNAEAELADPEALAEDLDAVIAAIQQRLERVERVWLLAHGEPQGARWEVDRQFFARLREEGIEIDVVDEWTGLARLQR